MEEPFPENFLFSLTLFKEDAENATQQFTSLFSQFQPSHSLSVEHLNCNKEQDTNAIIESLSLTSVDDTNLISSAEQSERIDDEVADKMSEEQKLVFKSIEMHAPKIKSDLLISYQNYLNKYSFPISINLPKLKIPIQYYEKKSEVNLVMDPQFVDLVEIDFKNEILYVPMTYSLTDLVHYYTAHLSVKIDNSQFLFYIDGNTYIPFKDDSQEEIELKDPANSLTQSLVTWLKQNNSFFVDSEIHTYNASKKRLIDLVVYLNRPYLMMVVYNTSFLEFQFSIRSCIHYDSNPTLHPSTEFINSSLSVSLFPLVIYKRNKQQPACSVCKKDVASFVVSNDVMSPSSPMYYCSSCMERFHYSLQHKLITPVFSAQPLFYVL